MPPSGSGIYAERGGWQRQLQHHVKATGGRLVIVFEGRDAAGKGGTTVVKSNDKKRARLEAMRYVLSRAPYDGRDAAVIGHPDPLIVSPAR